VRIDATEMHGADAQPSARAQYRHAFLQRQPRVARGFPPGAIGVRAEDPRSPRSCNSRRMQVKGRLIGCIAAGHDDRARAAAYAIAAQISARGAREHDARPIVARKNERPLKSAGREHHFARAHLPEPLARHVRRRCGQMIGELLVHADEIVREIAERGASRQQSDAGVLLRAPRESRAATLRPGGRR
jgi:hypothetical protein